MWRRGLVVLVLALSAASGCRHQVGPEADAGVFEGEGEGGGAEGEGEGNCPPDPVDGVVIPLVDTCSSFHICGATVIATNQETLEQETLAQVGTSAQDCGYQGLADKAGTFQIDITADGYPAFSESNNVVVLDGCGHAIPLIINAQLTPTGGC
ncbi:MAG TPA: hypothetical protein VGO62_16165 [Myxococcota bacterium]|jgi:hypothetical protein